MELAVTRATLDPECATRLRRPLRFPVAALLPAVAVVLAACGASGGGGGGWTAVANLPAATGAIVASVATDAKAYVAVGQVPMTGEAAHAAVWTLTDGKTWNAVPDQPGFSQREFTVVAHGSAGYLAVAQECGAGECIPNVIWRSGDGSTWTEAGSIGPFGSIQPMPVALAAGGPGWLGGGWEVDESEITNVQAAFWTSSDGTSWAEAHVADAAGDTLTGGSVSGIATFGSQLVAAGWGKTADGRRARAWTSSDGTTWTPTPDSPAFADGLMAGVAAGSKVVVAVGSDIGGAAVWVSSDGSTWDKAPAGPGFAGAKMTAVAATVGGFVAVGSDAKGGLAWSSADGKTWTLDPGDAMAGGKVSGVAAGPTARVAVGTDPNGGAIWITGP